MEDEEKTKEQLITELAGLRLQISELAEAEAHHWWADETLRALVEGTASATGDDFFRSLVYNLASALSVRYAFICEFADVHTRVRTLAAWTGEGFTENVEYDLAGTPCEQVFAGEIRHYPEGVQLLFPKDEDLVKLGAESYLAIPLMDPLGNVLGHLAVLDTKPMPAAAREMSILRIFAARAAAELQGKQAKEALRVTQFSIDRAGDAAFWIDAEARFFYVNDSACRSLGYSREELLSMTVHDIDPNYPAEVWLDHWRALKECGSFTFESCHRAKDGRIFPVEITINYLEFSGKEYNCAFARDITERRQAGAALRESEERFRSLVEQSLVGIYIIQDDRFQYVNPRLAEIFGYTQDEIISFKSVYDLTADDSRAFVAENIRKRLQRELQSSHHIFRGKRKDGSIIDCDAHGTRTKFNGKSAIIGTILDITERKRAEEQIKSSLQEKEVLLKEIHHRVKNNLQVIASLLRLQSGSIRGRRTTQMIQESQDRIKSMALIHEKLYQSKDLARVDFAQYIPELTAYLLRSHGGNRKAITLTINATDVLLEPDTAVPCGLIITELVSNALRHAFPPRKKGEIRIGLRAHRNKKFTLTVSDNGIGFPKHLDFRNTESLGMKLVRTLTDQLGGTIACDRRKGTRFTIRFGRSNTSEAG